MGWSDGKISTRAGVIPSPRRRKKLAPVPARRNYLQYSQVPQSAINELNIDSEARKRFFRNFEKFLVPGLQVQKSRISRDMKYF